MERSRSEVDINSRTINPECCENMTVKGRDEIVYTVFYRDGEEANDSYLSHQEAMNLAMELEENDNDVVIAKLVNNEWITVYET
ncbi:MAG: hypothetical protein GXY75_03345 [Bacteroidales bacterium]|jgi:hypothetical protein|nr:hypothetical protein [Bacteroidales bacterium]